MATAPARATARTGLLLPEELLLIALPPNGKVGGSRMHLAYGLAGAVILELTLRERVRVHDGDLEVATDCAPTGEELLDDALAQIARGSGPRSVGYWVGRLGPGIGRRWTDRVAERLVRHDVLGYERRRLLGLFLQQRYPVRDRAAAAAVHDRLRSALLTEEQPSPRTVVLLSLAHACRLTGSLVGSHHRKRAKRRIEELTEDEVVAKGVSEAVWHLHAASLQAGLSSGHA